MIAHKICFVTYDFQHSLVERKSFFRALNTLSIRTDRPEQANNVDPDLKPQNVASEKGLNVCNSPSSVYVHQLVDKCKNKERGVKS